MSVVDHLYFENQDIFFQQASEVEEELLLQKIYQQLQEVKLPCSYCSPSGTLVFI